MVMRYRAYTASAFFGNTTSVGMTHDEVVYHDPARRPAVSESRI